MDAINLGARPSTTQLVETVVRSANKAVNPSGGSGGFTNQRYLAAAGLPWSFCLQHMATPKFKIRLGSQQHLILSGKRYIRDYRPDMYNCRLSLRCGPLQASGTGDFITSDLQLFVNSVAEIVRCLRGECALVPAKVGTFLIHVGVANTGMIVTDVKITTLTSASLEAVGWNTHARFQTPWDEYYNPVDVECLDVARLKGLAGHAPSIEGRTKR